MLPLTLVGLNSAVDPRHPYLNPQVRMDRVPAIRQELAKIDFRKVEEEGRWTIVPMTC